MGAMVNERKILLLGRDGQVGWELQRAMAPLGRVVAAGREQVDLARPEAVRRAVRDARPDVIVNAAAYTAVDRAESEEDLAMAVNGTAPGVLAEEARRLGALLVHYSTDYVFDGGGRSPYSEGDPTGPLNAYGRSKLAGERAIQQVGGEHLIFRTSWVYGAKGRNFLLTMLRLAAERPELRVVADQHGAPTWSRDIATATAEAVAREGARGLFHMTGAGQTTWHGFAEAIVAESPGLAAERVVAISTRDFPTPAARPPYSVLSNRRLREELGLELPHWRDSLRRVLREVDAGSGGR